MRKRKHAGSSYGLRRAEGGRRVFRSSGHGAEIVYPSSPANILRLNNGLRVFQLVKSKVDQQCEFINFSVAYATPFRMLALIRQR